MYRLTSPAFLVLYIPAIHWRLQTLTSISNHTQIKLRVLFRKKILVKLQTVYICILKETLLRTKNICIMFVHSNEMDSKNYQNTQIQILLSLFSFVHCKNSYVHCKNNTRICFQLFFLRIRKFKILGNVFCLLIIAPIRLKLNK